MASEQHIIVLLRCSITFLHTYVNIQMWYLSTQIVKWCFKFNFKLLFCCWWWGTHPCTLKLLHIHVQHMHLSIKLSFQLVWFWGNKGGRGRKKQNQTPKPVRGPIILSVIQLTSKTVHISFLWTKFWQEAPEYSNLSDLKLPISCYN